MKASDIADAKFLAALDSATGKVARTSAMLWDIQAELAGYPAKVVLAKARTLMRRGLIDGCDCGCRGDFVKTAAGRALLDPSPDT